MCNQEKLDRDIFYCLTRRGSLDAIQISMEVGHVLLGLDSPKDKTFFNSLDSLERDGLIESWPPKEEIPEFEMPPQNTRFPYTTRFYGIKGLIPRSFKNKISSYLGGVGL